MPGPTASWSPSTTTTKALRRGPTASTRSDRRPCSTQQISEEECHRSVDREKFYAIRPVLPELHGDHEALAALPGEYSSANEVMSYDDVVALLTRQNLLLADEAPAGEGVELLR